MPSGSMLMQVKSVQDTYVEGSQSGVPPVVCFDIGGVMARICHTWQDAARAACVECALPADPALPLIAFEPFHQYQAAQISLDQYLLQLGELLGVTPSQALGVHKGILVDMYPGMEEFLDRLRDQGYRLGCLSNTNAPHWEELIFAERFAPIGRLELKWPRTKLA